MIVLQKYIAEILVLIFLIVTFLQSALEKISDWDGNIYFIKEHLKNTLFKNHIPLLLSIILVLEFFAVGLMIVGVFQLLLSGDPKQALYGIGFCSLIIIFLLVGQRMAKDYVGATSLTVYFILTILGIFLLNR